MMPTNTIINTAKKWEKMYNFQKSQAILKNILTSYIL